MLFSRRRFLWLSSSLSLMTLVSRLRGESNDEIEAAFERSFRGWVETLFPTDSDSLGAGQLGVHFGIMDKAKSNPEYFQLLRHGIRWADAESLKIRKAAFFDLSEKEAEVIVAQAEKAGLKSVPGLFFYHTLKDATELYYQNKESWSGVGFPHAPQPLGFVDYTETPK